MATLINAIGRGRDIPQIEVVNLAGVSAGTAYEHAIFVLPDLTDLSTAGARPLVLENFIQLRMVDVVFESTVTGAATNNFTLNVRQYRGGVLQGTIATVTFGNGTNSSAFKKLYVAPTAGNKLLGGDVLTLQNVQNGTGMAVPALAVCLEWLPYGFFK